MEIESEKSNSVLWRYPWRNKESLLKMEIESVLELPSNTDALSRNKESLLKMEIESYHLLTTHTQTTSSVRNKESLLKMEIESLSFLVGL